jgi:hypothetical protein
VPPGREVRELRITEPNLDSGSEPGNVALGQAVRADQRPLTASQILDPAVIAHEPRARMAA